MPSATLIALVVLLIAELVLRVPAVESAMGRPDLYYWAGVVDRVEAIDDTVREYGDIDVLVAGSSVVRTNFRPFAFDDRLASRGVEVVSFNGGLSGLRIDAVRLYIEEFWLERTSPRVVFQAVRYNEVLNPEPVEEFARFEAGRYEPLWMSGSPLSRLREFALDNFRLVQRSGLLTEALADPEAARSEVPTFAIDSRGWNETTGSLASARLRFDVIQIPGGDEALNGFTEPLDFALFDEGLAVLAETIAAIRAAGAQYVLVNMPEHGDKFLNDPDGAERYRLYVEILASFAESQGVPFIDVTNGDASLYQRDELFSDFHHMSPLGALELTHRLADAVAEMGILGSG